MSQYCKICGAKLPDRVEGVYLCNCAGDDKAYYRESRNFGKKHWVFAGFWKTKEKKKETGHAKE